jgi:hypothetical protein
VSLLHGHSRERTALLAAGALGEEEGRRAQAHAARCPECTRALAATEETLALLADDPLRAAEPSLPLGALVARVQARLEEELAPRRRAWPLLAAAGALAAVAVLILVSRGVLDKARDPGRGASIASASSASASAAGTASTLPAEALARLESALERERAARYLADAQDVLVTVAASPQRCARRHDAVEVSQEAQRSRDLLARRRLYVETDTASTVVARDVLDDVEEMLREVAALDPCARPQDLEAIRGEIARRRLLMKIDLVTRELQG